MVSSVLRHGFFLLAPPSLLILIEIMRMREAGFWHPELVERGGRMVEELRFIGTVVDHILLGPS